MSRLKILVVALAVLALVVGAAGWWFLASLDARIERLMEEEASALTGTRVTVSGVSVSLRSGEGRIASVRVANPEGFSKRDALVLQDARMSVDLASVAKPVVVIREVTFRNADALYELDGSAKANIDSIRRHAEQHQSPGSGSPEPKLIVRKFSIEGGHVEVDASALSQGVEKLELRLIQAMNVGAPNGETADLIAKALLKAIGREVARAATERMFWKTLDEKSGGMGKKLKSLFKKD